MQKKILFVLTSHSQLGSTGRSTGFYLPELTHPLEVVREAGYEFDFVSPGGGEPPMDGVDRGDAVNAAFLDDSAMMRRLAATLSPEEVDPADYAAVLYVGGHGTMWDFPEDRGLSRIAAAIYASGGVVAGVCHGPAGLVNVRLPDGSYLVSGRQVSAFTNEEEESVGLTRVVPFLLEDGLAERGAIVTNAPKFQAKVSVSDRLVTGQNPASARRVGEAVVALLRDA